MSLEEKVRQFYGKKFRFDGKEFAVVDVCVRENKAVIRTDKRTFVHFESELVLFMNSVEFIVNANMQMIGEVAHKAVVVPNPPETIKNTDKVNEKLMQMFDLVSASPSKEIIVQAETMVKLSDAMVKNELIKLRYKQIS